MFSKAWKLIAMAGTTVASILGIATFVMADDTPQLRTIGGRDPVVMNNDNSLAINTEASKKTAQSLLNSKSNKKPAHANAVSDQTLPVSDIELPEPVKMSKDKKTSIEKQIAKILNEKAMRNTITTIEVRDLDTGAIVYSHNADKLVKPASNNKLLTTAAALHMLGADYQFETTLSTKGKIEKGVLKGDLHLHIDHDFTWSTRFYPTNGTPLRGLVQQLKDKGIKKIDGTIIVSGYVVYGGTTTAVLNAKSHLNVAAKNFVGLLKNNKIGYKALNISQTKTVKDDEKVLALWKSPALSEAIVPLNRASHNEYADMLMMAMGAKSSGKNSYEAGAAAVQKWLKNAGIAAKGIVQHDGSGLSHDNRVSSHFYNDLTAYMLKSKYAREWAASLSIAGFDGTYGGRLTTDDGRGRVYAKSGTLRDVISGSGFFVNAQNGHTYAFSIIVNNMRQKKNTRSAIDRIVRAFLGDNGGSNRPAIPMMQSLRKEEDGRVVARWDQISSVKGYRVYTSEDGNVWEKRAETKDTVLIMPDKAVSMRVTAVSENGAESNSSLVFSYRPGSKVWSIIDVSRCRSDSQLRPTNHLFTHERTLSAFIDSKYGIETVREPQIISKNTAGVLWRDVACSGKLVSTDENIANTANKNIPFILNLVDVPNVTSRETACSPSEGMFLGCYADGVATMDRRFGKGSENIRVRKGAGSLSSRPTAIKTWSGAKSLFMIRETSVAAQKDNIKIVGIDLAALDSERAQHATWKALFK